MMAINNFKISLILSLSLFFSIDICNGQTVIIVRRTALIVDTSKSKFEQVHEIYKWITGHIRYDVKAYLNGQSNNQTATETLKKRRGICSDYSALFNEMCKCIGVESHFVIGYSKGAEYYKGGGCYRADHSWNVFKVDTTWYIADATWGSGYIKKIPSLIDRIKYLLFRIPVSNTKLVFVKASNDKYFNPSTKDFRKTHLPLDPAWQLSRIPYSIIQFENDNPEEEDTDDFHYKVTISSIGQSDSYQIYREGLDGKDFNPKNDFDIAYGFNVWADHYNWSSEKININNQKLFLDCKDLYQKADDHIMKYRPLLILFSAFVWEVLKMTEKAAITCILKSGMNLKMKIKDMKKNKKI